MVEVPNGRALPAIRWPDLHQITAQLGPIGPRARAFGLAGGAVVIWATWPWLASMAQPAPPFLILSLASATGFLCAAFFARARGDLRTWIAIPWRTALIVTAGLLGNNAFYLSAIARIGPAEANIVHYLWPVFMVGLSALVLRRILTTMQWVGIGAGFLGVALALSPQMSGGALNAVGVALGVCGALTFAVYSVIRAAARVQGDVVGPSMGVISVAAFVAHLLFEAPFLPSSSQLLAIMAIGAGPFTSANILWDRATRAGAPAVIGSLAFLTPLAAIILLSLLGLSSLNGWIIGGALLAVAGAVLTSRS